MRRWCFRFTAQECRVLFYALNEFRNLLLEQGKSTAAVNEPPLNISS